MTAPTLPPAQRSPIPGERSGLGQRLRTVAGAAGARVRGSVGTGASAPWLVGVSAAAWAALLGLALAAVPMLIVWMASPASGLTWLESLRVAGLIWLVAGGGAVSDRRSDLLAAAVGPDADPAAPARLRGRLGGPPVRRGEPAAAGRPRRERSGGLRPRDGRGRRRHRGTGRLRLAGAGRPCGVRPGRRRPLLGCPAGSGVPARGPGPGAGSAPRAAVRSRSRLRDRRARGGGRDCVAAAAHGRCDHHGAVASGRGVGWTRPGAARAGVRACGCRLGRGVHHGRRASSSVPR